MLASDGTAQPMLTSGRDIKMDMTRMIKEAVEKHKQWNHAEFIACLEQHDCKHYLNTAQGREEIVALVQHVLKWNRALVELHISFETGVTGNQRWRW